MKKPGKPKRLAKSYAFGGKGPRAYARRRAIAKPAGKRGASAGTWVGFSAMCAGMFMAILDIQVVATSLQTIQTALGVKPELMSWVQTSYLIAEVVAIPLTGWMTRVLTMRGVFFASISIFTIASIGCAMAQDFTTLLSWRVVQGFAGGMLIPAVFSAVFLLFRNGGELTAVTVAGVLAVMAPTIGPVVGGWITETYSWHWLFLINVGPGILAALAGLMFLPREKPDYGHARTLDYGSLLLMAAGLASLEIGLKEAPDRGWFSSVTLGLLALCAAALAVFAWRSLRRAHPLVDLRALADRDFALGCVLSFVLGAGLYGSVYLMPVFLGYVRGFSALDIGAVMLVTGVAQLMMAPIAVQLERIGEARALTALGFSLFAFGLGLSHLQTPQTGYDEMFWPQVVRGAAIMLCLLPPTRLALSHLTPAQVPNASGLFNLTRNLGGAIGLALIDTVIYGRSPQHAKDLAAKLAAGDAQAMSFVGAPAGPPGPEAAAMQPLIEKAAFTMAINEAWAMVSIMMLAGLAATMFITPREAGAAPVPAH